MIRRISYTQDWRHRRQALLDTVVTEYKVSMTPQERESLIAKIEALPSQLELLVAGVPDERLDRPYRLGGWTSRQVVHHLADSHMNAFIRTRLILTEENPTLRPYSQDAWAELADSTSGPLAPSLTILRGLHRRWADVLRSVPEEGWSRPATHPEYGATSLELQLKIYAGHGEKHLGHIRAGIGD